MQVTLLHLQHDSVIQMQNNTEVFCLAEICVSNLPLIEIEVRDLGAVASRLKVCSGSCKNTVGPGYRPEQSFFLPICLPICLERLVQFR